MSSVHMQSTTTFCTWKRAIAQVLRCSCSLHKWVSEASDGYCTNAVKERSLLCRSIMILLCHPLSYFIFQWLLFIYTYIYIVLLKRKGPGGSSLASQASQRWRVSILLRPASGKPETGLATTLALWWTHLIQLMLTCNKKLEIYKGVWLGVDSLTKTCSWFSARRLPQQQQRYGHFCLPLADKIKQETWWRIVKVYDGFWWLPAALWLTSHTISRTITWIQPVEEGSQSSTSHRGTQHCQQQEEGWKTACNTKCKMGQGNIFVSPTLHCSPNARLWSALF